MNIPEIIQLLCDEKGITIAFLERKVDLGNGTIRRWAKSSPSAEKLEKIATYFGVSTDFLLGREDERKLKEIIMEKDLKKLFYMMDNDEDLTWDGKPLTDETRQQLKGALQILTGIVKDNEK